MIMNRLFDINNSQSITILIESTAILILKVYNIVSFRHILINST